jgi:D-glycero-D-manno-heptose 1,7-bisphosphate phosphatase
MAENSSLSNPKSAIRNPQCSRAVFIDRDGTLNEDIGYVSEPDELHLYPWAAEAVRLINAAGLLAIVITNQSGIARGMYTEETLGEIHTRMIEELAREGARIDAVYYCPHHPGVGNERYGIACRCRKPGTGMLDRAAGEHRIDLSRSFVIGDKASDVKLAEGAGARSALVLTGYGAQTRADPGRWPCSPDVVADNLIEAVRRILDSEATRS